MLRLLHQTLSYQNNSFKNHGNNTIKKMMSKYQKVIMFQTDIHTFKLILQSCKGFCISALFLNCFMNFNINRTQLEIITYLYYRKELSITDKEQFRFE